MAAEKVLSPPLVALRRKLFDPFRYSERKLSRTEVDYVAATIAGSAKGTASLRKELATAGHPDPSFVDAVCKFALKELKEIGMLDTKSRLVRTREIGGGAPGSRRSH